MLELSIQDVDQALQNRTLHGLGPAVNPARNLLSRYRVTNDSRGVGWQGFQA
jgi:hypothetical protein